MRRLRPPTIQIATAFAALLAIAACGDDGSSEDDTATNTVDTLVETLAGDTSATTATDTAAEDTTVEDTVMVDTTVPDPVDTTPQSTFCPPSGPFGDGIGDTLADVTLKDCDGNDYALHDVCDNKAAFFFGYAGW
ncbi:MAG: hypothetical protein ACI9MR_001283 [Myxococcota bacterium]|jgi:hypothetical protein